MDTLDLNDFAAIVESYGQRWTLAGVRWQLHCGPTDRPKAAAWIDCEKDQRMAELIVWTSGEAELMVRTSGEAEPDLTDTTTDHTTTHYDDVFSHSQLGSILDRVTDHLFDAV